MRLLIAPLFVVLLVLAACGDDDSTLSTSRTPTATEPLVAPGQLTPNPDACTRDTLKGTLVSTEDTDDATILTLEATNTDVDCVFDGPPELRFYDADGNSLGVPFTPAAACEADATEYDDCVYQDVISLPDPDFNLPIGTPYKVRAIVSVTHAGALIPCASPARQARIVGVQFPGVPLDVQIELEEPIEMQFCSAQVYLAGYGPVKTGS